MEEKFSFIVTLLVMLLVLRNIFRKRPQGQQKQAREPHGQPFEPFNPFGPQGPFGSFNPFDTAEQPQQPRKPKAARKACKPKAAPAAVATPPTPILQEEPATEVENGLSAEEFDLRRAVIYSEILKPKFVEEEM